MPQAPISEEARRANGNLPGMGGVYNVVNLHLHHYAGNNPIKYMDPTGLSSEDGAETLNVIFFYKRADGKQENFQRAAETAANESSGRTILIGVETETDFKTQWEAVAAYTEVNNLQISNLEIFTHGNGLSIYFNPQNDSRNDSSLGVNEASNLTPLNFAPDGQIIMHSCRSGTGGENGIAQAFANSQGVTVQGQAGFSGFSDRLNKHSFVGRTSSSVYLESYNRTRNTGQYGDGSNNGRLMPRVPFQPR